MQFKTRELMRVFKDVGLVEQLGLGMDRILKVYDRSIYRFFDHIIKVNFPIESTKKTYQTKYSWFKKFRLFILSQIIRFTSRRLIPIL